MSEQFLVRTAGGPYPGDRITKTEREWPLPSELTPKEVAGLVGIETLADRMGIAQPHVPEPGAGVYRKRSESQLPPGLKGVIRGAMYEWVPAA